MAAEVAVPPALVTLITELAGAFVGMITLMFVALVTVNCVLGRAMPPKVTVVTSVKELPRTATVFPAKTGLGRMRLVMSGAPGNMVKALARVAVPATVVILTL